MKLLHGLSNGQLLQRIGKRGASVVIEGESRASGPVTATILHRKEPLRGWDGRRVGVAAKGRFRVALTGIPAGGPYRLVLACGEERAVVPSFYVGDLWVLAGQSNMQGVGNLSGAAKPDPLIRVYSMRGEWGQAREPLHFLPESPDEVHNRGMQLSPQEAQAAREKAVKGVGPGLFFAREMLEHTGVPQGLIPCAQGGTWMGQWDPALAQEGGKSLYGSLLRAVRATGQPVAGVLWYQGESDCSEEASALYAGRTRRLISAVRRDLRQPSLPWVMVQIGRVIDTRNGRWWTAVREAQRLLPKRTSSLAVVPSIDLPLDDFIHIGSDGLAEVGRRLALAASRLLAGKKPDFPQLRKIHPPKTLPGGHVVVDVEFENVQSCLVAQGRPSGFSFVDGGSELQPWIHRTTLEGNRVRLWLNSAVSRPDLWLCYGPGLDPYCNITDERGLSPLAFGPLEVCKPVALLPFMTRWAKTGVLPWQPVMEVSRADLDAARYCPAVYDQPNGFVNEHEGWEGQVGVTFFRSEVRLSEPMTLTFLMGYDGPIRIWLGGKPFFADPDGANPAVQDQVQKKVKLPAGTHRIEVAMDTNHGRAWGFFLRFRREGLALKAIREETYAVPEYLAP